MVSNTYLPKAMTPTDYKKKEQAKSSRSYKLSSNKSYQQTQGIENVMVLRTSAHVQKYVILMNYTNTTTVNQIFFISQTLHSKFGK